MRADSLSVSMARALDAWHLRPAPKGSYMSQIEAHAVAHGVSSSGLFRALKRAKLVKPEPADSQEGAQ